MQHFAAILIICALGTRTVLGRAMPVIPRQPCQTMPTGIFIENPKGCQFFYYCNQGQAVEANCPGDLWFNIDSGICDVQTNVNCTLNDVATTSPPPITLDEPVQCPARDPDALSFLASQVDCGRYYICYHGRPQRQQCIQDLHWNAAVNRCDYPTNAKCLIKPELPDCPRDGLAFYPHPDECEYFIYCNNGVSSVQQCPFYHHWDVVTQSCRWRNLAKCALNQSFR